MIWQMVRDLRQRWRLRKREIFRYFDGKRTRYGDPFAIARAIHSHETIDFAAIAPAVDLGKEPETSQALDLLVEVFQLTRWNGTNGMTDAEVLDVFQQFDEYLEAVKKNSSPSPISSPPMDAESLMRAADPALTGKHLSGSGKTDPGLIPGGTIGS